MFKGWKTLSFMAAGMAVSILDLVSPEIMSDALGLTGQGRAILLVAVPTIGFLLRMVTSTPIGRK